MDARHIILAALLAPGCFAEAPRPVDDVPPDENAAEDSSSSGSTGDDATDSTGDDGSAESGSTGDAGPWGVCERPYGSCESKSDCCVNSECTFWGCAPLRDGGSDTVPGECPAPGMNLFLWHGMDDLGGDVFEETDLCVIECPIAGGCPVGMICRGGLDDVAGTEPPEWCVWE